MANAGVCFASDLHRRLVDTLGEDAAPSEAHVSRLVRTPPERLNLATLDVLCVVLACSPADLLHHRPDEAAPGGDTVSGVARPLNRRPTVIRRKR